MSLRTRLRWCVAVLVVGAAGAGPIGPPVPVVTAEALAAAIDRLGAADPAVRAAATEALAAGKPALVRPAVIRALPTASPEAAARLADALLRTAGPWSRLAVPPSAPAAGSAPADQHVAAALHQAFDGYARAMADDRCQRVEGLPADAAVVGPLTWVLRWDPSPAVRWSAAGALRAIADRDPDVTAQVLALAEVPLAAGPPDPAAYPQPADNGPLLAAGGWAARLVDPARADTLIRRALAIEAADPSAYRGQADFAYEWAAERAVDRHDYPAAAALLGQQVERTGYSADDLPQAVGDWFAVQAEHGPYPGFAVAVALHRAYLGRPEVLYCLARLAQRRAAPLVGPASAALVTAALDVAALAANGVSSDGHCATAMYLFRQGWPAAANRELAACLATAGGQSGDAYYALYEMADSADDNAQAGRYLDAALRRWDRAGVSAGDRYGGLHHWTDDDAHGQVHWHYLRAATAAGDHAAERAEVDRLLALNDHGKIFATDPGMVADVVPVLAAAGDARAGQCFDAAYAVLQGEVAKDPAEPMYKNNLAWLCAKSGRNLGEADALSAEAVRLEPADAACLDTRAEVLLRLGRPADAVAAEERALAVKPRNVYMRTQLARFRAAAAVAH